MTTIDDVMGPALIDIELERPLMAGSAVAGSLSLVFNATLRAPHGGIWVVGVIGNWLPYLVAIVAGTVVTAFLVNALKSMRKNPPGRPGSAAPEATAHA